MTNNHDGGPSIWPLFGLALLTAVFMVGSSLVSARGDSSLALRVMLAIVPLVPAAALAWAIVRAVQQLDEMHRKIHLDAMTGAFVATAFVAIGYGQLQHARVGLPELNWAFLWPAMVVLWAVSYVVAARRYQ
jgi:hypothetical protein